MSVSRLGCPAAGAHFDAAGQEPLASRFQRDAEDLGYLAEAGPGEVGGFGVFVDAFGCFNGSLESCQLVLHGWDSNTLEIDTQGSLTLKLKSVRVMCMETSRNLSTAQSEALRWMATKDIEPGRSGAGHAELRTPTARALERMGLIEVAFEGYWHSETVSGGFGRIRHTRRRHTGPVYRLTDEGWQHAREVVES